jgi:hypothetical protein
MIALLKAAGELAPANRVIANGKRVASVNSMLKTINFIDLGKDFMSVLLINFQGFALLYFGFFVIVRTIFAFDDFAVCFHESPPRRCFQS